MFDFSWTEILLIAVVALVVIGPKDLPRVLRTAGQWAGRARAVAREFQGQIDQMIRDSELDEVRKTMNAAASGDPNKIIKEYVDPTGEIEKSVNTPDMMGISPTMPAETPAATETALGVPIKPMIEGPVPPFLQSVLQSAPPEPVPVPVPKVEAPAPEAVQAAPSVSVEAEPKSGTHG
jgi:sec-independent protein translocase protein TatB